MTDFSMADRGADLATSIEQGLKQMLPRCRPDHRLLNHAIRDAVFPGGKRLRPVFSVLGASVFGAAGVRVLEAACAVEFVHTTSLIIDDLPCMDDAHLRRGKPALHLTYGEAIALLAGISLLNEAYRIFGRSAALAEKAAECIGVDGMTGGQALDLAPQEQVGSLADRNRKTSALMRLAATAGALSAGVPPEETRALDEFGLALGYAYQIMDDLSDDSSSSEASGKTSGQDVRHGRPSYRSTAPSQAGVREVESLLAEAASKLSSAYGQRAMPLLEFVNQMFKATTR